jgi:TRAP-type mannitol/chloroaromatic compound transport system permease large subunit
MQISVARLYAAAFMPGFLLAPINAAHLLNGWFKA